MKWTITLNTKDGVGVAKGVSEKGHEMYHTLTDDELIMLKDNKQIGMLRAQITIAFDSSIQPTKVPVVEDFGTTTLDATDAAQLLQK